MCGWDMQGVDLRDAILSHCNMAGAKVRKDMIVGSTLPEGDKAPTVTPGARFEVAQGVTESVVTSARLPRPSNWNPVTLLVPSVEASKTWTLKKSDTSGNAMYVCCHASNTRDTYQFFRGQRGTGVATCTRSGSTITFNGPYSTVTHPCTPGQEARVPLQVLYGNSLTLAPQ
ncbi:hypothetical protein KIPB_007628 [Kipferlia bialata]|uniref:Uncharacterized protein n=2 Tax=Kipferlia bialata TaxID=797122 RepID=A0A9K3D167_9EUKA|nr:hypothetical protein KIPB_007628 [Kipferlia bialata]|eukprot:g7628.t1